MVYHYCRGCNAHINGVKGVHEHIMHCPRAHVRGGFDKVYTFRIQEGNWGRDKMKIIKYPKYFLFFDISASATVEDLDDFLRSIWVDCCGHLSSFTIEDETAPTNTFDPNSPKERTYMSTIFNPHDDLDMASYSLHGAFHDKIGTRFSYMYDFGTPTLLAGELIQIIDDGRATDRTSVRIIARNTPHEYKCCECEGPASWVEQYEDLFYCTKHMPEDDEGISGVANSPRMGMCGYEDVQFDTWVAPVAHVHHATTTTKKRKTSSQSDKPSKIASA